ncbi:hypothetical protein SNEBB_010054 [Seison nebaliae]|nr:hypothetical protein SNEBB_010054 [Seison nebaliae]
MHLAIYVTLFILANSLSISWEFSWKNNKITKCFALLRRKTGKKHDEVITNTPNKLCREIIRKSIKPHVSLTSRLHSATKNQNIPKEILCVTEAKMKRTLEKSNELKKEVFKAAVNYENRFNKKETEDCLLPRCCKETSKSVHPNEREDRLKAALLEHLGRLRKKGAEVRPSPQCIKRTGIFHPQLVNRGELELKANLLKHKKKLMHKLTEGCPSSRGIKETNKSRPPPLNKREQELKVAIQYLKKKQSIEG